MLYFIIKIYLNIAYTIFSSNDYHISYEKNKLRKKEIDGSSYMRKKQ